MCQKRYKILVVYVLLCLCISGIYYYTSKDTELNNYNYGNKNADGKVDISATDIIEEEFVALDDDLRGISLFLYKNDNTFNNEELIVECTVKGITKQRNVKIASLKNETNFYVDLPFDDIRNETVYIKIYGKGISESGLPSLKSGDNDKYSSKYRLNGQTSDRVLTMTIHYEKQKVEILNSVFLFLILIVSGIIALFFYENNKVILRKECGAKERKRIRLDKKKVFGYFLMAIILVVIMEFTYHYAVRDIANEKIVDEVTIYNQYSPKVYLSNGDEYVQTFKASTNYMSGIKVPINIINCDSDDEIIVKVYDKATSELIYQDTILAKELGKKVSEKYIKFDQLIDKSNGRMYSVTYKLQSENGKIAIVQGDLVSDENAYFNDRALATSMALKVVYQPKIFLKMLFFALCCMIGFTMTVLYWGVFCSIWNSETVFLIVTILFGVMYCSVLPVYSVPDELSHIDTAYRVSNYLLQIDDGDVGYEMYKRACDVELRDDSDIYLGIDKFELIYDELGRKTENVELVKTYGRDNLQNAYIINYLPAGLGITIGRLLQLNYISLLWLGRLCNLLVSVLLMYWGIRKLPFGRTTFMMIGLFPISLQQIMSFSYDGVIIGIAFVFAGYVFNWIYSEEVAFRDKLISIIAAILIATCKGGVYLPVCFLIFLIPFVKKTEKKNIWGWLGVFVLICLCYLQKNPGIISRVFAAQGEAIGGATGEEIYTVGYLLKNPIHLIRIIMYTFYERADVLFGDAIGQRLGWLDLNISWVIIITFFVLLVLASIRESQNNNLLGRNVAFCVIVMSILSIGLVMASMLISWTPISSKYITGIQGRYFLPIIGPMFLLLRNLPIAYKNKSKKMFLFLASWLNVFVICEVLFIVIA